MAALLRGLRSAPTFRTRPLLSLQSGFNARNIHITRPRQYVRQPFQRTLNVEHEATRQDTWIGGLRMLVSSSFLFAIVWTLYSTEKEDKTATAAQKDRMKHAGQAENQANQSLRDGKIEFVVPEETPEDAIFLSLWLPSKVKKTGNERFYHPQDPAFRSMLTLLNDEEAMREIQDRYCQNFSDYLRRSAHFRKQLGQDFKVVSCSFDFKTNGLLPEEFERQGIEYDGEWIYNVTRKMTHRQRNALLQTIWPTGLLAAFKEFWMVFYQAGPRTIFQAGNATKNTSPPDADSSTLERSIHQALEILRQPLERIRSLYGPGSTLTKANRAFLMRLHHDQTEALRVPSHGDVLVSGVIEMTGWRGEIRFGVHGFYNVLKKNLNVVAEPLYLGPNWKHMIKST